jgi:hypothetical protein
MKKKELFITAIEIMMFSWGSDPPQECHWALKEFIHWFEKEHKVTLTPLIYDEHGYQIENFEEVMQSIRNS